jgi:rRNA maturation RNase YbeY
MAVHLKSDRFRRAERTLGRTAGAIVRRLTHKRSATVAVFLVPGATLRRLKLEHYYKRAGRTRPATLGPVDVLSFPEPAQFPHPDRRGAILGEVYLNKALLAGPRERLLFLLVHGVLHLLGYQHEKKRDSIDMERLERKLLDSLMHRRSGE